MFFPGCPNIVKRGPAAVRVSGFAFYRTMLLGALAMLIAGTNTGQTIAIAITIAIPTPTPTPSEQPKPVHLINMSRSPDLPILKALLGFGLSTRAAMRKTPSDYKLSGVQGIWL